jgi:UDP-glucose 4-epimerase
MKILFTGGNSFTGVWIVRKLALEGHEVICPLLRQEQEYDTALQIERLSELKKNAEYIFDAPFGSNKFLDVLTHFKPEIFCHHASLVQGYQTNNFNPIEALEQNTKNFNYVAKSDFIEKVIYTGSIFQANAGLSDQPYQSIGKYGLSKLLTQQMLEQTCINFKKSFGHFIISNPFGALENPKITNYLFSNWKKGKQPYLKAPFYIRDHIPVELLATYYSRAVLKSEPRWTVAPCGYVGTVLDFANRFANEVTDRTGMICLTSYDKNQTITEPRTLINRDNVFLSEINWNEIEFWDQYIEWMVKN